MRRKRRTHSPEFKARVALAACQGDIRLVSFLDYDPGFFDEDVGRVQPAPKPQPIGESRVRRGLEHLAGLML